MALKNYDKVSKQLTNFIKEKTDNIPIVIGLSGGIDSTLTCELALTAIGNKQIKAITLKNARYSNESLEIVKEYVKEKDIDFEEIDTNDIRNILLERTGLENEDIQVVSSLDARITDLILRTVAQKDGRIYLGTINGSERLTGWFPKNSLFGDLCPIGGLLKHEVQELAKHLGLSDELVESVSEDASKVCSGCGELPEFRGISYSDLDKVLELYELGARNSKLRKKSEKLGVSDQTVEIISNRIEKVKHKREQFPPYPTFR